MTTTPNILLVMADQMSALATPLHNHPVVKAPHIASLGEQGIVFNNAYCSSPLCGPSRHSMMSGRMPSAIGAYDNAAEFSSSIPTFAHYLRRAGYRTCLSGKMHFVGPDQLHGYEERLTTDIYPADFGWTPNWSDPEAKVRFQDMSNVVEAGPCERSMQIDYDDDVENQAVRWLYDRARDEEKQPFMLTVSFTSPHDPYMATPEFWDLYDSSEIDLPTVAKLPDDQRDAHTNRLLDHYFTNETEVSEDQIRQARHGYYASISYIDAKIGAIKSVLERTGLGENTIIIFTADHGDMMGERGMYYKKSFFEWSLRVPLVVYGKGLSQNRIQTPVSLVDLLPTLVDMAGGCADVILDSDGTSLWPAICGETAPTRTIAAEFLAEGVFDPVFMLRDSTYKFIYSENDAPVLYDMLNDPLEITNLADDPKAANVLENFQTEAIARWNCQAIREQIIKDQNNRLLVEKAHGIGKRPQWDFQPYSDASTQFVRAGKWTTAVEGKAYLPTRR